MPPFFLLIHLILFLSTPHFPSSSAPALKFDYLTVNEYRHPPHLSSQHQKAGLPGGGGGNLSIELHHRDAIAGRIYATYRHRITDLLRRDSLRVDALHRRLSSAYRHIVNFGSDIFSGLDQGSGEYFVQIGFGSPPRKLYLVVDSGSDLVWVQCEPCAQCYSQSDPVFDPARSASFFPVSCGSPICALLSSAGKDPSGCSGNVCRYQVLYGDGSSTHGTLALETLTFGAASIEEVAIGCGHLNRGLFVGAAGLLGLGWGQLSFVSQLGGLAGGAFSYCLPSRESPAGVLVFGRSDAVAAGAVWVPLLLNPRAPSFYYVGLVGLGIGGVRLAALSEEEFQLTSDGQGGTVVDTGTAVTRLPAAAYEYLRDGFVAAAARLPRAPGVSIFDTCYALGGYESVQVPTLTLYFAGGAELTLPARNFLIPVDDAGTFCLAFAASASGLAILGNIQQEGIQMTVDAANGFLGFGPNTC